MKLSWFVKELTAVSVFLVVSILLLIWGLRGRTSKPKAQAKPNAVTGFVHWLIGAGQALVMKASSISWQPTDSGKKLLAQNVGASKTIDIGASAQGLNGSEQIGRVTGTFTGSITKTYTGYTAHGTFTPNKDVYDFNNDPSRGWKANAVTGMGQLSGMMINHYSFGIIRPTGYDIQFEGSAEVEWSW